MRVQVAADGRDLSMSPGKNVDLKMARVTHECTVFYAHSKQV